jgi:hypothetical protein
VADWVTISSLATAGGTLALAVATYSSVRSANRSARIAERSLQIGLRPVLAVTRYDDPPLKVDFGDRHRLQVAGAMATIENADEVIYLAFSVRNVGSGLAVMRGWHLGELAESRSGDGNERERLSLRDTPHPPVESFRRTQRDIYVPAGDIGFWQGAIREPDDPFRRIVTDALRDRRSLWLDLLYGDHEEGQPTITRFGIVAREDNDRWSVNVARHWSLERERG